MGDLSSLVHPAGAATWEAPLPSTDLACTTREVAARRSASAESDSRRCVGEVLYVPELWLLAVAEAESEDGAEGMAAGREGAPGIAGRLALDQVRAQVERHRDSVERFRRHPTQVLRAKLQDVLRDAFQQATREVHALGHRHGAVGVSLDAILVLGSEVLVAHGGRGEVVLLREGLVHRLTGRTERAEEPGDAPPARDPTAPPGEEDELDSAASLLGLGPDAPVIQVLAVGLSPGDRLAVLGASVAAGLTTVALRRVQRAGDVDSLADALASAARVPTERPLLVGVVQPGGAEAAVAGEDRLSLLRGVEIFRWCSVDELLAFVGLTRPARFSQGELLLRQGALNTTLYLLVQGRVGVNKDGQRIAETGAGSIFGEMSMLDEPRASATVEALTDIEVLTIDRDAFLQALKRDASMAVKVLWSMLLRVSSNLRTTSQRLAAVTAGEAAGETAGPPVPPPVHGEDA